MRTLSGTWRRTARRTLLALLAGLLLAGLFAVPPGTHATPPSSAEGSTGAGVGVDAGPPSLPTDGAFTVRAEVRVEEPTPYLEVRFQLRRPSGALLFQRTEVRSDVETGTVTAEFTRELADLSLPAAAYPYEIRVRTEVGEPRERVVEGHLLLHAPRPAVTPVALVIRVAEAPGIDPAGNFVVDPAAPGTALDQVALVAGAVVDDPRLRLTLGIPGMTLDAWSRVASGYTLSGPAGLVDVPAEDETPRRYAAALDLLREAVATGRLELLDVPYGDPDIGMLVETGALLDLGVHYAHSRSAYLAALETSPSAGTAVVGDAMPPGALDVLAERDIAWALLDPGPLTPSDEETVAGGVWGLEGSKVLGLVADERLTARLPATDTTPALMRVFDRAVSEEATVPLVAAVEAGPGRNHAVERVLSLATVISSVPWADVVTASSAAAAPPNGTLEPPAQVSASTVAPAGYPSEVVEARRYAVALEAAAGVTDPDVAAINEVSLVAQSARWAGPDGSWSMADRGRAFAAAAVRGASELLDQVTLTVKDVTLPGARGDVPVSVANGTAKDLSIRLVVRAGDVHLPGGGTELLSVRPQENLHTVSVDLRSSLSGRLEMELWAGEVLLDSASSTVRASYLDRLAVVGGVALLLLGLLVYIRRRVRAFDAGKMR